MTNRKKKKNKLNKKVKIRIFLFFVLVGSILVYLGCNFFTNLYKIVEIKGEKQFLNDKLASLRNDEIILNSDIKKLKDPEYIAKYAREKYLYSKDGELIIRIPDDKN